MADLGTISNLATAAGTLVLAVATFASIRSANRSARFAERALMQNLKPVLVPSRTDDRYEKLMWADRYWARLEGGRAIATIVEDNIYLAVSLRNVGSGIGILQGYHLVAPFEMAPVQPRPPEQFRLQTRDLYIPAGDTSYWQAGLRDKEDEFYQPVRDAIEAREPFSVQLLYSDHEGGQRTISWVSLFPHDKEDGEQTWLTSVARHWTLDRFDPRH
ncbi:MAG TPA: hypothetical protein VHX38_35085 [Pseudonocardiaceae bacterium]|nr:hypothetical protein [Pseudonocardiaceae bacterium]